MTLVTIAVPVHNGGRYLDAALTAVRRQSHPELDIVVAENASTDDSAAIAAGHSAADARLRICPAERALDAIDNFNRCVDLARGEYFMWAAHDDRFAPDFVERCLAAHKRVPDALAAVSRVRVVDADDAVVEDRPAEEALGSPELVARLRAFLVQSDWVTVYALYRTATLRTLSGPMRRVPGPDVLLSWQLLLRGSFVPVTDTSFDYRRTTASYKTALDNFAGMLGERGNRGLHALNARLWLALWRSAGDADLPREVRRSARGQLIAAARTRPWVRRLRDDVRAELDLAGRR